MARNKKGKQDHNIKQNIDWHKIAFPKLQDMTTKIRYKLSQVERGYRMRDVTLDVDIEELEQYVYNLRQALPIEEISKYNQKVHQHYKKGLTDA